MTPDQYPTKTEFSDTEKAAISRYAKTFIDFDTIPEEIDIPDDTKNWRRAIFVPTIGKVFEGATPLEGYNEIMQKSMPEITDNSGVSTVAFDGYWDDTFLVIEPSTDGTELSTKVPAEYTPYELQDETKSTLE